MFLIEHRVDSERNIKTCIEISGILIYNKTYYFRCAKIALKFISQSISIYYNIVTHVEVCSSGGTLLLQFVGTLIMLYYGRRGDEKKSNSIESLNSSLKSIKNDIISLTI